MPDPMFSAGFAGAFVDRMVETKGVSALFGLHNYELITV
jgi:hypothetical protein